MSEGGHGKARVLVAGGGVAGLEAALALRALCRGRVAIELLAASETFAYRPLAVAEPFGLGASFELDLAELADGARVELRRGELACVDLDAASVETAAGERLGYDYLVVAIGGRAAASIPGAISFTGRGGVEQVRGLLGRLEAGEVRRVVFAGGATPGWPLPLYELALLTAHRASALALDAELTVVTEEPSPLAAFGGAISADLARLLDGRGIRVERSRRTIAAGEGRLELADGDPLPADAVVTVPGLEGPGIAGLPSDRRGFVAVDDRGRIAGRVREFAAGDLTSFPIKHGGIAAQQADVAADAIAQDLGCESDGRPFRPTLEGTLLAGDAQHLIETSLAVGETGGARHRVEPDSPPWRKIAARHLGALLATRAARS